MAGPPYLFTIPHMAAVSTYLNFANQTRYAFEFYRSVFGGEYEGGVSTFGDIPPSPEMPEIAEEDKNLVMHVCLPILGGHKLMGTDAPASMGFKVVQGNNVHISLHPDTRAEADRIFSALSAGGEVEMPMQDMFWGAYYGAFTDKFGVRWMINCDAKK